MTLEEARKNFQEHIAKGNKLTYEQIKMLNTLHKGDYVKQILKEDDQGMEYLKAVDKKVLEKNNEISQLMWDITDIQDTWE